MLKNISMGKIMVKHIVPKTYPYLTSVSRNILLTFLVVSFLPLCIITASIFYRAHVFYHEKIKSQIEAMAKLHTQNIDTFLEERLSNIRLLAGTANVPDLSNEHFLQERLNRLQQEYGPIFSDLGVVDKNGRQVAYAGPFLLDKAVYADAAWFRKAVSERTSVSDVFLGLRGLPHFIVTVRKEYNGSFLILRATIDFRSFSNLVGNLRIGETGFAFILNKEGEFQTKTVSDESFDKSFYLNLFFKEPPGDNDRIHYVESRGISGDKTIYAAAPLKGGEWLMIFQQNSKDAFKDLRKTQLLAFLNFLFAGFVIITTAVILSRRVARILRRKDIEKEMMNDQIIESGKLASLGELAAGIAHEINNPVAIMVEEAGWIEDLLEEEAFEKSENLDEFRRALKQINTQGIRCRDITQKLLSFARKADSSKAVVCINDLIDDVVALSSQQARYSNVMITTGYSDDLPLVNLPQTEIQQVMLNLINNAMDAMEKTGGLIHIDTSINEDAIIIQVADNGPGIPEISLSRIFDPFFTTKPVGKGTGLGLSICYGIISRMGGKISVKSNVGAGTTFEIQIPYSENTDTNRTDKT